ncbi:MAG: hypothetical protein R3327_06915 [Nitrosopumilaceae archaeon]|nr:hypothetical protein [Nitrosopumilaceae archaeon]
MNLKLIYASIFTILFVIGILLLTLTEIFTESWLTGLGLVGIAIVLVIILTIKKFKN